MIAQYFGLIEFLIFAGLALGFCAWQYWTVRDAGKPSPQDARHPEREHQPDDGGSQPGE
jgi:hypothetical protein